MPARSPPSRSAPARSTAPPAACSSRWCCWRGAAAGALLMLGPALLQDAARRRRGGHHAAPQLRRAALRADDAGRPAEGPDGRGLAAVRAARSTEAHAAAAGRADAAALRASSSRSPRRPGAVVLIDRTVLGLRDPRRRRERRARRAMPACRCTRVMLRVGAALRRARRARRRLRGRGAEGLSHRRPVAAASATPASWSRCSPASHPLGVVPAAIFVAGVFVGADTMSRTHRRVQLHRRPRSSRSSLLCVLRERAVRALPRALV